MNAAPFAGLHSDLTGEIINAAIEVHTELGCGLKEEAYEAALAWELTQRGHKVLRQVPCPVVYKENVFCQDDEHPKRIDLLVDDMIVVELKAVCTRHPVFAAQCRTYLRMLDLPAGLVLNFGFPSLRDGISCAQHGAGHEAREFDILIAPCQTISKHLRRRWRRSGTSIPRFWSTRLRRD